MKWGVYAGTIQTIGVSNLEMWSSNNLRRGFGTVAKIQDDGNFVLYNDNNKAVWAMSNLMRGQTLDKGEFIASPNGRCKAVLNNNGNFDVYIDGQSRWNANVYSGSYIRLQPDGNLVIYNSRSEAQWSTGTSSGDKLSMDNSGNLVLQDSNDKQIWATGTRI